MAKKVPACTHCSEPDEDDEYCGVCGGCRQCCGSENHCPNCMTSLSEIYQSGCDVCQATLGRTKDEVEGWTKKYAIVDSVEYEGMRPAERAALVRQRLAALEAAFPEI